MRTRLLRIVMPAYKLKGKVKKKICRSSSCIKSNQVHGIASLETLERFPGADSIKYLQSQIKTVVKDKKLKNRDRIHNTSYSL